MKPSSLLIDIKDYVTNSKHINNICYYTDQRFVKEKSGLAQILGIDYWQYIPPPPLNNSKNTTSELTEVIRKANNRTQSETNLVITVDQEPLKLFDTLLSQYKLTFPNLLFDEMYIFLSAIIKDLKIYFNRARPAQLAEFYNTKIDILHTSTHHTPSYPSGHTAYASLIASILSDYYPQYKPKFWHIAKMCGEARVLQGVHYPLDNNASISLVQKVYLQLKALNTQF